jgi:hypothetical protein
MSAVRLADLAGEVVQWVETISTFRARSINSNNKIEVTFGASGGITTIDTEIRAYFA